MLKNQVILEGNLANDVMISYVGTNNTACVRGTIFVPTWEKDKEDKRINKAFRFTIWGKRGETFADFTTKGTPVTIVGSLDSSEYEKEGQPITTISVVVDEFQVRENKQATESRRERNAAN